MRDIVQHTSHRDDGSRHTPKPFQFCHRPERCLKRLVGATLLATLVGLLFTVLFIPEALK